MRADYLGLAARMRAGVPIRAALSEWHAEVEGPGSEELRALSRRLYLGQPTNEAIGDLHLTGGTALARTLDLCERTGADAAAALDELSRRRDLETERTDSSRAAASGAKLSARMIVALPLLFLPMSIRTGGDLIGLLTLFFGLGLVVAGWRWMAGAIPVPPREDDPVAALCDETTRLMACGISLSEALSDTVGAIPGAERVTRSVALGLAWDEAVGAVPELGELGATLSLGHRYGLPMAAALTELASRRRAQVASAFEVQLRRAPVLMVLPLTLCVLPAFVLLALVPLLRSLRIG